MEMLDPYASHHIDRLKGYTGEHIQYFQVHFWVACLGVVIGVLIRPHMMTTERTSGTQLFMAEYYSMYGDVSHRRPHTMT
jgi:hypothetical protein